MTYIYLKNLLKNSYLMAGLIFLFVFSIYSITATPQAVGLHDSDYLIYISTNAGTLPSPSYPLLSFIFFITTNLFGSILGVAFTAHLTNALLMALSSSILFLILQNLYNYYQNKSDFVLLSTEIESNFFAGFIALIFGFSKQIWRYGVFAEKYSLSVLLMTLILYFFIQILILNKNKKLNFLGLFLILGLGISHQWIFLGIFFFIILFIRKTLLQQSKQSIFQNILFFLIGLIVPFFYLLITKNNTLEYTQILPHNFKDLLNWVLTNYLGDGYARSENLELILESASLETVTSNIFNILKLVIGSFGFLFSLLFVFTLAFNKQKKQNNIAFILCVILLGTSLLLALVFDWNRNLIDFPEILPQTLILHPIMAILLWFGLKEIITRFGNAGLVLTKPKSLYFAFSSILIIIVGTLIYSRYNYIYLNNKVLAGQIAKHTLESVEDNSIIACFTEFSCYGLIYHQKIEKINQGVIILPFFYLPQQYHFSHTYLQTFDYNSYPMVMFDILTSQRYQRPIYTVDMFEEYFSLLGIDYGFIYSIPYGYYNKLVADQVTQFPPSNLDFANSLTKTKIASWDYAVQKNKLETIKRHLFNASIYMKSNQRQLAQDQVNLATTMAYGLDTTTAKEISGVRQNIESVLPRTYFELGKKAVTPEYVLDQIPELLERGQIGRALLVARGALTLDHTHIDSRLKYASLLESVQASDSAVIEYNNVLKLDPENQIAKDRLEYQQNL